MKTCCLVWEIPVIEGEHYNPIINVIYMQKAKKFLNQLNRYFQDENMDWKCVQTVQHVLIMRFFSVKIKQLFLLRKLKQDNGYIKKKFRL